MTTAAKPRPMKIGEERSHEVEGMVVVLRKVEPTTVSFHFSHKPVRQQKARYEIIVDGALYGHVNLATGFGTEWYMTSLGGRGPHSGVFELESPQTVYPSKHLRWEDRARIDRDELVRKVPGLIRDRKLMTREAIAARIAEKNRAAEIDKAERERRHQENEAQRLVEKAALRVARVERAEALEAIRDRLRAQMTNAEIVALSEAIDAIRRKVEYQDQIDESFSDKYPGI